MTAVDRTVAVGPVYLAGPITPKGSRTVEFNVAQAVIALRYLTDRRIAAICPQLTAVVPDLKTCGYEDWMAVDFVLIAASKAVLALPGWDKSDGTRRELLFAGERGIPVFYRVRELLTFLGVEDRARGMHPSSPAYQADPLRPSDITREV